MNVDEFILKLAAMKVSEAKAIADKLKALPDGERAFAMMKLVSIIVMTADEATLAEAKKAYERLAARLGREPTAAELEGEVRYL